MALHGSRLLLAVLALASVTSCGGDTESSGTREGLVSEQASTLLDYLPALRRHLVRAGAANAGDARERPLFDDDWYAPATDGTRWFGRLRGRRASLDLIVQEPELARFLELDVLLAQELELQGLEVFLNEASLGRQELSHGWQRLVLPVPEGLVRTGGNRVELVAEYGLEQTGGAGKSFSLAIGEVLLTKESTPTSPGRTSPELVSEPVLGSGMRLEAGQVTRTPVFAHPGGVFELVGACATPGQSSRLRVCARARHGGPILFERVLEFSDSPTRHRLELGEASGDRLELELGNLSGQAPVQLTTAGQAVPREFSDLIFVVVDTLRADRVLDPDDRVNTPRLDEFAAEGVQFSRAFSHANLTLPSHTAMFSSRLPSETRVALNTMRVRGDLPLLSEWMQELGYRTTATISMGTLQPVVPEQGLDRGFASFDDDLAANMDGAWANERLQPDLASLASSDSPFFLFVHYSDPHGPYRAHGSVQAVANIRLSGELLETVSTPDVVFWEHAFSLPPGETPFEIDSDSPFKMRFLRLRGPEGVLPVRYEVGGVMEETRSFRAVFENSGSESIEAELGLWLSDVPPPSDLPLRYDLEVEYVDGVFGRFLDELKRIGRFEDSLIVFTSDHGEGLGDHGEAGHGKILYNEQVHVPLIIKAPAGHSAAVAFDAERNQLVSHMDLVPTALDVLELPSLPGQRGTSLLVDSERLSISESHFSKELGRIYAIRDGRYVLMYGVDSGLFALFDTLEDPGEEVDIFASRGHEFEAWQQVLREIGAGALDGHDSLEELTSESRELLRGLGYTDGDE